VSYETLRIEIDRLREEVARLRADMHLIAHTDPVDAALDPERAIRVARAAVARVTARASGATLADASNDAAVETVVTWKPATTPLLYLTRCADGTTFMNSARLPAHAVEWAVADPLSES
jgi:hypothetical protein